MRRLSTEERVKLLLALVPYYMERQYSGNYYDNDDINDILAAVENAGLTKKQRLAIEYVYFADLTTAEAAVRMNTSKQAVSQLLKRASSLVVASYERGNTE